MADYLHFDLEAAAALPAVDFIRRVLIDFCTGAGDVFLLIFLAASAEVYFGQDIGSG